MSEFHEGRVAATFQVGSRLEDTKESYEKEIVGLDGMKAGLIMAVKNLQEFSQQISRDIASGRLPLKEGDVALKYVASCGEMLQKMATDTEAKRFAAVGAIEALKRVVAEVKIVWEQEQAKLREVQEFEAQQPKDLRTRPVGYMPKEKPIDDYKKETEHLVETQASKPKKGRKT